MFLLRPVTDVFKQVLGTNGARSLNGGSTSSNNRLPASIYQAPRMPTSIKKKAIAKPQENSYEQAVKAFYRKEEDSSTAKKREEVLDEF
mgnify:CR=1 FL=1